MSIYLHDIPLTEARKVIQDTLIEARLWQVIGQERIPLDEIALDRVLAEPIWAKISSPHYHASAMDGFAIRSADSHGASQTHPIHLSVGDAAIYVDTGDPIPEVMDAVVPIENVESLDGNNQPSSDVRDPVQIRLRAGVTPWAHVRPLGEDMIVSQLVLPEGHVIRPTDLGAIAAAGHDRVTVARKPRVAIIPTGSELVPIGEAADRGEFIEYNSVILAAQISQWGGEATRFNIVPDEFDRILECVQEAAEDHDLILLNAGSSAGSEDHSAGVVKELGRLFFHGVAIRPGHPVIFGMIRRNTGSEIPIIGVPGYPVSTAMTGEIFVEPLLSCWLGRKPLEPVVIPAFITQKITSPPGDDDFVRVAVGRVRERVLAAPLARGAGVISSLSQADGIVIVPRGSQGLPAGEQVEVRLYRQVAEIERTIFAVGSHDMTIDLLAMHLAHHGRRMTSANIGSQGGLIALSRQEAHLAGSHLLDPKTGDFNIAYIHQYLPDVPVIVVTLVGRQQGLIVAAGNPLNIHALADLTRQDLRFVNRQHGSGTRVLLDYHLDKSAVQRGEINGFGQVEYTHLGVAAAVASGRADCGLGIAAAANALELSFIPLFHERYDLVIPREHYESELLSPIFDVLNSSDFREAVNMLPGYDVSEMGKIVEQIG